VHDCGCGRLQAAEEKTHEFLLGGSMCLLGFGEFLLECILVGLLRPGGCLLALGRRRVGSGHFGGRRSRNVGHVQCGVVAVVDLKWRSCEGWERIGEGDRGFNSSRSRC
jgi:hypothetical protein